MEFKKAIPYGIRIDPTINGGFIVTIGCSVTLAYGDLKQLRKASEEYFADPEKVEKEYSKARHEQMPEVGPGNPPQAPATGLGSALAGLHPAGMVHERK